MKPNTRSPLLVCLRNAIGLMNIAPGSRATNMSDEEIKRVIDPIESFHLQLKEEVESYERLKRGEFDELENLRGLGHRADRSAHCAGNIPARIGSKT